MGVVVVISPGGLGIREGVLIFFLKIIGFTPDLAVTISITSRLWFVIGEGYIFILAFILNRVYSMEPKHLLRFWIKSDKIGNTNTIRGK
jgi:uncharacterized membrane protein YbhN (UPF0104 family)